MELKLTEGKKVTGQDIFRLNLIMVSLIQKEQQLKELQGRVEKIIEKINNHFQLIKTHKLEKDKFLTMWLHKPLKEIKEILEGKDGNNS